MSENIMADLSVDALKALLREAQEAQKLVQQATAQRVVEQGAPMLQTLVDENALTYSRSSAWVGISANGMPFTAEDGTQYTVSVTITHTSENERRKAPFAEAKKFADEHKLTGDKRKDFIAGILADTEPAKVDA